MGTSNVLRAGRVAASVEVRIPPRAPARAMQVVEALALAKGSMSLAAISAALELPKTSLLHLLRALEAGGYVWRAKAGFQLGPASYGLAAAIDATDGFSYTADNVLQEVWEQTRETVLLGKFSDDQLSGIYFQRLESPQSMRFTPELHERRPMHCTSLGKVLLAFSDDAVVEKYLRTVQMERFTSKTISSRRALLDELKKTRARGVAISIDEMVVGGGAMSAPVFDRDGRIRMALVIAVPSGRLVANISSWSKLLKSGAAQISATLGHAGVNRV